MVSAPSCFPFETHSVVSASCPAFIPDDEILATQNGNRRTLDWVGG
jgi:hypothetical protein